MSRGPIEIPLGIALRGDGESRLFGFGPLDKLISIRIRIHRVRESSRLVGRAQATSVRVFVLRCLCETQAVSNGLLRTFVFVSENVLPDDVSFFRAEFRNALISALVAAIRLLHSGSFVSYMQTRAWSIARKRDLSSPRWSKRLLRARRTAIAVRLSSVLRLKRLRRRHPYAGAARRQATQLVASLGALLNPRRLLFRP